MITPRFSCSQTESSVVVAIYCPSVRVEINVDETLLTVHINPYFLRLNFSGHLLEDDASSARYDPGSGYLTVTLTKEAPGEIFRDLDLLAKLLAPRPSAPTAPAIEVLKSSDVEGQNETIDNDLAERTEGLSLDREREEILHAAENDWHLPQESEPLRTSSQVYYGFLDTHTGYFAHVTQTANEILLAELGGDAETCPPKERRARRIKHEDAKFDEEHYMADYADDTYIQEFFAWNPPPAPVAYTEEENLTMLRLPRKEYLFNKSQEQGLYLTLLTILFAHAYDARSTQGDPSTESAWTLVALTPAFSALDPAPYGAGSTPTPLPAPAETAAVLAQSYRRALAFPLYRSFALAEACRADVARTLLAGVRGIVHALLEVKRVLDAHEAYYVFSKIWIDDFCTWVQVHASDESMRLLGEQVGALKMEKAMVGWGLDDLEAAADRAVAASVDRASDSDDESESD
ncbi:hypothetical protein HWV62_1154 [Athelia sp. TMB]|nr:hypothetical protein HWV62_1154 [Athelia sp. TMB]